MTQHTTDEANAHADALVRTYLSGLASGYATALAEVDLAPKGQAYERGAAVARAVYADPLARNAIADQLTNPDPRQNTQIEIPVRVARPCAEGDHL